MKKIHTNILYTIISFLPIWIFIILEIFNNEFKILVFLLVPLLLLFYPGYLILSIFKVDKITSWLFYSFAIGCSVAFDMIYGFSINILGTSLLNNKTPLDFNMLFIFFVFGLTLLATINILINRNKIYDISVILTSCKKLIYLIFPILSLVLAILGTFQLNNEISNTLLLISLLSIVIYILTITLLSFEMGDNTYATIIFLFSVSMLLMYSLRSGHITGWDINEEYRVFRITYENGIWLISNSSSPYNALLSITIFPTIISRLSMIPLEYVFKLVFPILYSVSSVALYFVARNILDKRYSLLAVFFIMGQFTYMQQMPALNRQEIAFLFLSLMMVVEFAGFIHNYIIKNLLFLVFGVALILSHYSTTYIALGLFLFVYSIEFMINFLTKSADKNFINIKDRTSKMIVLILLSGITFFWYGQYTKSAGNLNDFVYKTYSDISHNFSFNGNVIVSSLKLATSEKSTNFDIDSYDRSLTTFYKENIRWISYYPQKEFLNLTMSPEYSTNINTYNSIVSKSLTFSYDMIRKLMLLLIVIGIILYFLRMFRTGTLDSRFGIFGLINAAIINVFLIIPQASTYYNYSRLYQQTLMVLSIFALYGVSYILKHIKFISKFTIFMTVVVISFYFLYSSGFVNQFMGGNASFNLNNYGEDYDRFYTHDTDVASATWLGNNFLPGSLIYADDYASLKIMSYTDINTKVINQMDPHVFDRKAYVYGDYTNIVSNIAKVSYNDQTIGINFPVQFLNDNKNLIYSNGRSEIYK